MQLSLVHTVWNFNGSTAGRDTRISMSPKAMLCSGSAIPNYQPKQTTGDLNRLEQEI